MKKYLIWGALLTVACAAAGYVYAAYFYKVTYVSSAQLIVLTPKNANKDEYTIAPA